MISNQTLRMPRKHWHAHLSFPAACTGSFDRAIVSTPPGGHSSTIEALLAASADSTLKDANGETPLEMAVGNLNQYVGATGHLAPVP